MGKLDLDDLVPLSWLIFGKFRTVGLGHPDTVKLADVWKARLRYPGIVLLADFWKVRRRYPGPSSWLIFGKLGLDVLAQSSLLIMAS